MTEKPRRTPDLLDDPNQLCFTGLFLSAEEQARLLSVFPPLFDNVDANHITTAYYGDNPNAPTTTNLSVGELSKARIIGQVVDQKRQIQALLIDKEIPNKPYPHITVSTGVQADGSRVPPVVSNMAIREAVESGTVIPVEGNQYVNLQSGYWLGDYDAGRGIAVTSRDNDEMSNLTLNSTTIPDETLDLDRVTNRMIQRTWPDYSPEAEHQTELFSSQVSAPNEKGFYLPIESGNEQDRDYYSFRPDIEYERRACDQLIDELCGGVFAVCGQEVATAIQIEFHHAVATAYDAHTIQSSDGGEETDATISLQSIKHLLVSTLVMLGQVDYPDALDDGVLVKPQISSSLVRRDGMVALTYATSLLDNNSYAAKDGYDDFDIPGSLTLSVKPDQRVMFEMAYAPQALRGRFTSNVQQRGHFTQETLSIRIDRDEKSPTGFSLDFGRDKRNNTKFQRSPDALGRSMQLVRPDDDEGGHFYNAFSSVTDQQFKGFSESLAKILAANIKMQAYDKYLRDRQGLGYAAMRPVA